MPNLIDMQDAKTLWSYHYKTDHFDKDSHSHSTIILGLGSYDIRVAEYCAELYLKGYGYQILFTGKSGNWTRDRWTKSEAEVFADIVVKLGVPKDAILVETQATNIGENIINSRKIIEELKDKSKAERIILITKPNTTRRAFATFKAKWPEINLLLSAPTFKFGEVAADQIIEDLINEMVGDIERIIEYPASGFQIHQNIPKIVLAAYQRLKSSGYDKHCLKSHSLRSL